ncbi:MAG: PASTA domain-containing protein, partial [Bacillota bacterium]|nr:PASTA domain-containing protein [Bacillota bacterium]
PVNVSSNHVDDIEDEGVDNKTKKIIIGVLAGILVLALGIVAAFAAGGFFSHKPNTGGANVTASSNIEVPNVIGFTEADAKAKIESMGLTYTRSDEASDDKIPAGSVIMTFPTAGTKLKANQEVRVRISKGPGKTTVPVLVGSDLDQAKSLITGTGFDIVVADRQYNDTAPENSIISQNPLQDTEADKGTKIQVVVSLGKKYTPAVVPDLKGKTIQQAQTILTNSKLKLGTQTPVETKDATLVGQIFSQDIAKDTKVDEQTAIKVSYYVKAANTDIVVPPLANKTLSEAQTILANLKLALGNQVSVETTDDTLVGKIFDQTPASGSTVQQGASVDVKYYVKKQQ